MRAEAAVAAIHGAFEKWLFLDNWWVIDVVAGAVLGNRLMNGSPVWMAIVGPPGSAKTVIVESLRGVEGAYGMGGFTQHTFASGMKVKKGNPEPGILAKLSDRREKGIYYSDGVKYFAFNDFSTLFAMDSKIKNDLLAQMRQVYDGHFEWEWGTGKKMDWYGRVGAVAAATEEWDSEMDLFRRMGERFLIWREYRPSSTRAALRALKQDDKMMKLELQEAMGVLNKYDIPEDIDTTISHGWIADLGEAVAIARTPIKRDRFTREPIDRARPESGARLSKQLNQLLKGLILFRGESSTHEQVRYPVLRAAVGSLPQLRLEFLGELPAMGASIDDMADLLHTHRSVVRRAGEDLLMLRVLAKEEGSVRVVPHPSMAEFCKDVREIWAKMKPTEVIE